MSKLNILSPTLTFNDVEVPQYLITTSYIIDISSFPILLVAVTYVVTWLRYKLDIHCTGLLLLFLMLSLINFLGLFLNGGVA